jgi:hypothetical protein
MITLGVLVHAYTDFCVSELRKCLRSECSDFEWPDREKIVQGKEFRTSVDLYGEDNKHVVLIQFEMRRESGICTNALKLAYCLESDPYFAGKKTLILHVLSPFSEEPKQRSDGLEQISIPEWVPEASKDEYSKFVKRQIKEGTRESARRSASKYRLLLWFLKRKGVLDNATTIYEVIEWNPADPNVREATIVLPERGLFPANTQQAVAVLTKQLGKVIEEWQKK